MEWTMNLLKELFASIDMSSVSESVDEKDKKKKKPKLDKETKFSSFLGGNMFVKMPVSSGIMGAACKESEDLTGAELAEMIVAENKKQQSVADKADNKLLNNVLKSKKGGRHFSPKTDYKRSHEKADVRKSAFKESDE